MPSLDAAAAQPLHGVVILDLTTMLAGPYATMVLADLGADVIKIEPPEGEFIRHEGPHRADDALRAYGGYFQSINRNKRSITIDLTEHEGRELVRSLVRNADAVIENYRHGVMERFGLGYEELREINPSLVYAAIRGFGDSRTGESPMRDWPAYDITGQAISGFMEITGDADGPPTKCGPGLGDMAPGLFAAIGLLSALHRARVTGVGSFVDVAMYDAMLALCERTVYQYSYTGIVPRRQGNTHPLLCPYEVVAAVNGWVSIAAPGARHWGELCRVLDRDDLATDPRTSTNASRIANREYVRAVLVGWTSVRTTAEILEALGGLVPVARVNAVDDVYQDAHVAARSMLVQVEHPGASEPVTIVNTPIKFADSVSPVVKRAPLLGEHTGDIIREARARAHVASVQTPH